MTDSVAVLSPLQPLSDNDGNPVSGGTLEFYVAGTSTPKTVYSDSGLTTSLGTTVTLNAAGMPVSGGSAEVMIYVGVDAYKVILKDSLGATLRTRDNVKGAIALPVTSELALPETPVNYESSTFTTVVGDQGKLTICNATSGSFSTTLPSALDAGDGWRKGYQLQPGATTNTFTFKTTGGQAIKWKRKTGTSFSLTTSGQTVWVVCDGAGFIVDSETVDVPNPLTITDRLASPPGSPSAGAMYIINGTPTGAWSTLGFALNDIAVADGNGSYYNFTPVAGWLGYVADENLFTLWSGSSWDDQSGMAAPSSSVLKMAVWSDTKAQGTSGGTPTATAWTQHVLQTEDTNTITSASLASNQFTLPAGSYHIHATVHFQSTNVSAMRLRNITDGTTVAQGINQSFAAGDNVGGDSSVDAKITITGAKIFQLEYYVATATAGGLGTARNVASESEVYARVIVLDLASIQGPRGAQGPQGPGASNAIMNGAMMVAQQGTSFTSATTPANNNDTYTLDGWNLITDGNNVVNVARSTTAPTNGLHSLSMTVATINKKFGVAQFIEQKDCIGLIGETVTLSFKAMVSSLTNLDNVKCAIIAWDGTADALTSSIVSGWNAEGTTPTLNANWTYENTPVNLSVGTSWGTFSVTASVDTASCKNIGVFIWSDVTTTALTEVLYVTDVQIEASSAATTFRRVPIDQETARCQRYYHKIGGVSAGDLYYTGYASAGAQVISNIIQWPVAMRVAPTLTIVGAYTLTNCGTLTLDAATERTGRFYAVSSGAGYVSIVSGGTSTYLTADARL